MALSIARDGRTVTFANDRRAVSIPLLDYAILTAVAALLAATFLVTGGHMDALKAAGVDGGSAIAGVGEFVGKIKDNLIWVGVTVAGAGVILIGVMFLTGHTRAQDYAMRFGIGCLIIAGGTGLVA